MSLAETIAKKHGLKEHGHPSDLWVDKRVKAAINEALERAAQECEISEELWGTASVTVRTVVRMCSNGAAARIRALKG